MKMAETGYFQRRPSLSEESPAMQIDIVSFSKGPVEREKRGKKRTGDESLW
jgi:hypothetical protein